MTTRQYENALTDEALDRVRTGLMKGPLFGFHMYYGGGRSGSAFVFTDFDEYVKEISEARAGDIFLIWSIAELENQNQCLEKAQSTTLKGAGWTQEMLERASAYLRFEFHEVLVIYGPDLYHLQALLTDIDGMDDLRTIARRAEHTGVVGVYPFSDIDKDEFYFLKVKRPDANGVVPEGGAY